jgi:hypothetical protein
MTETKDIAEAISDLRAAADKVAEVMAVFEADFAEHGMKMRVPLECGLSVVRLAGRKDAVLRAVQDVTDCSLALEGKIDGFTGREPRKVRVSGRIRLGQETWDRLQRVAQKRRSQKCPAVTTVEELLWGAVEDLLTAQKEHGFS